MSTLADNPAREPLSAKQTSGGGKLKVLAFTGGHNTPSRVPRLQHYVAPLSDLNICIVESPSRAGLYPPAESWKRPAWGIWNLAEHIPQTVRSYDYDLTFFQREMLSTFVTLERFTKRPRILDVDDAIWVHPRGGFAGRLARLCDHVICGNRFLAEHFARWNTEVSVLPTSVDARRFCPQPGPKKHERPVIGWLGLSSGFPYLYSVEEALRDVLDRHPAACLRIVSDKAPEIRSLPEHRVEFVPYCAQVEVDLFRSFSIGIMPLDDSDVSRGKCSYKMLQYMACGTPVVASPVGMNAEVFEKGQIGFAPQNIHEWTDALDTLLKNPDLGDRQGHAGREVVMRHYSVEALAPRLGEILLSVGRR